MNEDKKDGILIGYMIGFVIGSLITWAVWFK